MKYYKLVGVGLVALSLLTPPVEARRHRGGTVAAVVAAGAIAAAASRHHHRHHRNYGSPYYGSYYGTYGSPYYYTPYSTRVYGSPIGGAPMVPGASTCIDEGAFRNYYDAYGNYIGRVPLTSIPPGYW